MKGDPVPHDLDVADTCAYIALTHIYAGYKAGLFNKLEAREKKEAIVNAWNLHKSKIEFVERKSDSLAGRIKEASDRYVYDSTVENADRLYAAFWGLRENWREDL
jgi:hypothetical protein